MIILHHRDHELIKIIINIFLKWEVVIVPWWQSLNQIDKFYSLLKVEANEIIL